MAGAEFTLEGTYTQVTLKGGVKFEPATDGTWYLLKNGKYTTQAPIADYMEETPGATKGYVVAEGDYEGTDTVTVGGVIYRPYKVETDTDKTVYVLVKSNANMYEYEDDDTTLKRFNKVTADANETVTKKITLVGTSDASGHIVFKGLGEGIYVITETITPAGFNTIAPFKLQITCTYPSKIVTGEEKCTWGVGDATTKKEDANEPIFSVTDTEVNGTTFTGIYSANIINMSGLVLPSTGGIGTTIFYVTGSILVLAAVVLLVTKKRMVREK